jgi:hypothetical protein
MEGLRIGNVVIYINGKGQQQAYILAPEQVVDPYKAAHPMGEATSLGVEEWSGLKAHIAKPSGSDHSLMKT